MRVGWLGGRDFRNLEEFEWSPAPYLNLIVGENGQGKTSVLEALGLFASLRSFRGAKNQDLINLAQTSSQISALLVPEDLSTKVSTVPKVRVEIKYQFLDQVRHKLGRAITVNSKPIHQTSQYLQRRFGDWQFALHAIDFNPSSHDLVRGEPSYRREYLDRAIVAQVPDFLDSLRHFKRSLEQRNALLKNLEPTLENRNLLQVYSEELAHYGVEVFISRLRWLKDIQPQFMQKAENIAPSQKSVSLAYQGSWYSEDLSNLVRDFLKENTGLEYGISLEIFKKEYQRKLKSQEAAEWAVGHTLSGPHRDDWQIQLDAQPIKGHGSQGEVRTALLGLKLAEIELFRSVTGHRPIFLLDDFSSELDLKRRQYLMKFLENTDLQAFVTTTEDSLNLGTRVQMVNGRLNAGYNPPLNSGTEGVKSLL
jgi:DNA replication and repair protein RecF